MLEKTRHLRLLVLGTSLIAGQCATAGPPKEFTNSIGMKFVLIPAGEFMMGSPEGEKDRNTDEGPQHRVRITKPFYLGQCEVTQSQYDAVMGNRPWSGKWYTKEGSNYAASWFSWEDAVEFCRRLSRKEGRTYRLPTEAQWEYACRGGSTTAYHFGNDDARLGDYAWFEENADGIGDGYTHEIGRKKANLFGLYDMHGNVWEWCSDWYDKDYYAGSPVNDPPGPATGSFRVGRGGCWRSSPGGCRSAFRNGLTPANRYSDLGFRVALAPPDAQNQRASK